MSFAQKANKAILITATIATLASGLALTEASAAGYQVDATAKTVNFPHWDRLNIRAWPASHSQKIAHVKRGKKVYVERCIIKSGTDWCKIRKGWKYGWVNGSFLRTGPYTYANIHPWF